MYTIYGIDVADAWEKEKKNGFNKFYLSFSYFHSPLKKKYTNTSLFSVFFSYNMTFTFSGLFTKTGRLLHIFYTFKKKGAERLFDTQD